MKGSQELREWRWFRSSALLTAVAMIVIWSIATHQVLAQWGSSTFNIDWSNPQDEYPIGVGVPVPASCPVRISMRLARPPTGVPCYSLLQFQARPVAGRSFPSDGTVTVRLKSGYYSYDQETVVVKISVRAGTTYAESEMLARTGVNETWLFVEGEWNGRPYDNLSGQGTMSWSNLGGVPMRLRLVSAESVGDSDPSLRKALKKIQNTNAPYTSTVEATLAMAGNSGQLSHVDWVADVAHIPKSWLAWAHFDDLCISLEDLRKLDDAGLSIVRQYVWCGGRLEVLNANRPLELDGLVVANWDLNLTPNDPEKQTYRAGFGSVVLGMDSPSEDFHTLASSERSRLTRLSGDLGNDYWNWLIPEVGKTPIWTFLGIVLLIVGIGAPSILLWSQRIQRRVWTILAIPVLSLASVLSLFFYATVKDGWRSLVRIRSITTLDVDGNGAVWSRQNYFAGTLPEGKIRIDANAELIPLRASKSFSTVQYQDESGQEQIHSGILALRQQRQVSIAHFVKDVNLFRMESRIESESGIPATKNISELTLLATVCSDNSGRLFRAENIAPGQTVSWQETDPEEAVKWLKSFYERQGLSVPADAPDSDSRSLFTMRNPASYGWRNRIGFDGFQEEKYWEYEISDWGADNPYKFVAFVDRAPKLEKCLDDAKETASLHMVVGRWRAQNQKPTESPARADESEGKGLQQEGFGEE